MMDSYEKVSAELGGDVDAQIAALMLVSSHEQRKSLHQARQAAEKHLEASEHKQVQSMRDQADAIETAAVLKGVGQMCEGAGQITAGGFALGTNDQAAAQAMSTGTGQVGGSGFDIVGSYYDHKGAEKSADATAAGNRADADKRTLDDIRDNDRDARDVAHKALDMVDRLEETRAAMNQAALFKRV
jgi:hypothetical protein